MLYTWAYSIIVIINCGEDNLYNNLLLLSKQQRGFASITTYVNCNPMNKIYGILFILTGTFAILGGFYTWGNGSIFSQTELLTVLIPWADIVLTGPLSIITGYGILNKKNWGEIFGLITSGIYIFGSVLVFITIIWNNDYSIFLLVPSLSGFFIGTSFAIFKIRDNVII